MATAMVQVTAMGKNKGALCMKTQASQCGCFAFRCFRCRCVRTSEGTKAPTGGGSMWPNPRAGAFNFHPGGPVPAAIQLTAQSVLQAHQPLPPSGFRNVGVTGGELYAGRVVTPAIAARIGSIADLGCSR